MVVCDEEGGLIAAVVSAWPSTFIKSCEHHLRANAIAELKTFRRSGFGDPLMGLLNGAFATPAGWAAFRDAAWQSTGASMQEWLRSHDAWISEQAKRRSTLPQHHSTGAIEPVIGEVREFMAPRAYCYRNAERTNLMLELVRLRLNRLDDPDRYAQAIREHLDANDGQLPTQGQIRDPRGVYSLRV